MTIDPSDTVVQAVCGSLLVVLGFTLLWAIWQVHRPFYRVKKRRTSRAAPVIKPQATRASTSTPRRQSSRR